VCAVLCLFEVSSMSASRWKEGEGGYALMRRYGLDKSPCSFAEFYKINNLKYGEALSFGKKYFLPIKVYKYNNSSIRSTLKNFDLVKALEVERYNKWIQTQKLKSTYFLQDRLLWVPYYVYNCEYEQGAISVVAEKPTLPAVKEEPKIEAKPKNIVSIPLFGTKYEDVEMLNDNLKGRVFYIKCGHGGPDPGAMVKIDDNVYCEDEYAYDIALRLGRLLISHGAIVHFIVYDPDDGIRDDDYLPCDKDELHAGKRAIPVNQILRLRERVAIINSFYYKYKKRGIKDQRFISIHIDSRSKGLELDTHFYYSEGSKVGYDMAVNTQAVFEKNYAEAGNKKYTGTIKSRDLYVVKYSHPAALFVEVGNIQNEHDQKRFIKSENRQALAQWLFEGVIQ
jgi:N-acetylmuramoyl-L-alanine amidase